jgi:hypothetical protein
MEEFVIQLSESDMDSDVNNETDSDSDAISNDEHDRALQIEEQDTLATLRNILSWDSFSWYVFLHSSLHKLHIYQPSTSYLALASKTP